MFGFGFSGKAKAKIVPTGELKPANSFDRENLDDLIDKIDEAEHKPVGSGRRSKARGGDDIDDLLHAMEEDAPLLPLAPRSLKHSSRLADDSLAADGAVEVSVDRGRELSVESLGSVHPSIDQPADAEESRAGEPPLTASSSTFSIALPAVDPQAPSREKKLRAQIEDRFRVLMSQMLEFHVRLRKYSSKLLEQEAARTDLELSVSELENENTMLRKKLDRRDGQIGRTAAVSERMFRSGDARRNSLLFEQATEDFTFKYDSVSNRRKAGRPNSSFEKRLLNLLPFSSDVRKIQSRFGSGVAAYFDFYRFMFAQFSLVACVCVVLGGVHVVALLRRGADARIASSSGVAPSFIKFSSFAPSENLLYASIVVSGSIIFQISLFLQVIYKDKLSKELDACEALNDTKYAKVVLCTWDFALLTKRQREEFSGTLAQGLRQQLCDTQVGAIAKRRSTLEVAVLGLRRAVAFLLYLVLQVAAMALILYITVRGGAIENNVSDIGFFRSLAPFFSAIVLSVVNSSVPYILKLITALETWDNPTLELNVLLFRMYFSNTFNVLILAGSYALLADPLLLAQSGLDVYRRQVEIQFNAGLHVCRMDQVAEGLFSLLLTAFGLKMLMVVLNPLSNYLYSVVTLAPYEKTEFDIASSIISMLYLASIAMLLFPYAPVALLVLPPMLFVLVKWEKYVMLHLYLPPKRPWKAQKAGQVFSFFYLVSFFLVGLPASTFFFSIFTFPKSCGIQDAYVHLCAGGNVAANNTCVALSPKSSFVDLYGDSSYCARGYPACVCERACGPFIFDSNNIAPFREAIQMIGGLDVVWAGLFQYPYGPWAVVIISVLSGLFLRNSLIVQQEVYIMKEQATRARIDALEASNKEKEKRLEKIKAFEAITTRDSFAGGDPVTPG